MTRKDPPRAATLAAVLARALPEASPHRIALAVGAVTHAAKAHRWVAEARCNYNFTEAQETRQDRRLERLETEAWAMLGLAADSHCPHEARGRDVIEWVKGHLAGRVRLEFGGDPRGCCGSLIVSDMRGDGWGDGFAIY